MDHFRKNQRSLFMTVTTDYLAPTEDLGSRYVATNPCNGQFSFVYANYELNTSENHLAAAMYLLGEYYYGNYVLVSYEPDRGSGYIFTFEVQPV